MREQIIKSFPRMPTDSHPYCDNQALPHLCI